MSKNNTKEISDTKIINIKKKCFVIMPISGVDGYDFNYFKSVYTDLIKGACSELDLEIFRADEEKEPNLIQADIVKKLIEADLVICDISFHNPNVLFELGIRQAFDKPVILIKDKETKTIFDISGIRYIEYDREMKYKDVVEFHKNLKEIVEQVLKSGMSGINSLISLVSLKAAKINVEAKNELNPNDFFMFNMIENLIKDMKDIKEKINSINRDENRTTIIKDPIFERKMMELTSKLEYLIINEKVNKEFLKDFSFLEYGLSSLRRELRENHYEKETLENYTNSLNKLESRISRSVSKIRAKEFENKEEI